MKLSRRGTPRAVLEMLSAGPVQRTEAMQKAIAHAEANHAGTVALRRLEQNGLIVCEYRLTDEGVKVLEENRR